MSTALQVIERAFRKLGTLAAGESASSDMSTDALADLNAMLARWLDLGIEISQGEITLTDTIPSDIGDEDAVVYGLAAVLLMEYPSPVGQVILSAANAFFRDILMKYTEVGELTTEEGLLPIHNTRYNINSDS